MDTNLSPEEIAKRGEDIYIHQLKSVLEPAHDGEYVVIEVGSGQYKVDKDPVKAIKEAQAEFPNHLFHVIRVGSVDRPTVNYHRNLYARQI